MTDIPMSQVARAMADERPSLGTPLSKLLYPFYLAGFGSTTLVRFLPDMDSENALPWVETHTIRLPFGGIVNSEHDSNNDTVCMVPAMSTWGKKDRITESLKPLWNGNEEDRTVAKLYYRKISYLMPAMIVSSAIVEKTEPESPIRLLKLGKQLHDVVKAGLLSAEFEWSPFGYEHGRDFKVTKTQQGTFANYSTSGFSFKERPLNKTEREAIAKHGLLNLADFTGIEPDADIQNMIYEMYQASKVGAPFDNALWGGNFRAFEIGGDRPQQQAA
jgi:hypothetical protein